MQFVMIKKNLQISYRNGIWPSTSYSKTRDGLKEPQTLSTDVNVLHMQQWTPDIKCSTMDRPHSRRRGKSHGWSPPPQPFQYISLPSPTRIFQLLWWRQTSLPRSSLSPLTPYMDGAEDIHLSIKE